MTEVRGDIGSLLKRGDDYARSGDPRAAISFYQNALRSAQAARVSDPALVNELRRAQMYIQDRAQEFQRALEHAVAQARPDDSVSYTHLTLPTKLEV